MARAEQPGLLKYKGILFGDDNWGRVYDEQPPYKNSKGILMKKYLVIPGEHLTKQYPELQKPENLTHKGFAKWVEYPMYWISDNNPSRTNAIARVACGFDGRATDQTRLHERYIEEIQTLQNELEIAKIKNIALTDDIKTLSGETKALVKDYAEINNLAKGDNRGKWDREGRDEEEKG